MRDVLLPGGGVEAEFFEGLEEAKFLEGAEFSWAGMLTCYFCGNIFYNCSCHYVCSNIFDIAEPLIEKHHGPT